LISLRTIDGRRLDATRSADAAGLTRPAPRRRGHALTLAAGLLLLSAAILAQDVRSTSIRIGFARPGGGYTVETLPLETYVARVLAGEALRDSRPAALEALAITLRTFAEANRGRHRADGFDLCDQTHCQVVRAATPATERAAHATAGRLLLHDGAPASVYYSASCGGRTEIPSNVWPGAEDPPFMPSVPDDACGGSPVWTTELAASDLLRALREAGFRGRLDDMQIARRNSSGRVARVSLRGLTPDAISGQDLRVAVGRTLGWQYIKSTAFELRRAGTAYRFSGHGSGHGVGLCVIGSAHLAEAGEGVEQILARYFPGLAISSMTPRTTTASRPATTAAPPSPAPTAPAVPPAVIRPKPVRTDVMVALPDGDEGERPSILQIATRERDALAHTLGVAAPAAITLRVHATTDEYERSTGQAWFTSGALVNGELHLLPLAVLRDRGVFERTIRHELVHLMTDSALAGRPAWVREGAAIYFAGERPLAGAVVQRPAFRPAPRPSCPSDAELLHPVSVGALSNAYARARACFAKQLDSGKRWQDIK
jgi:SpoIID/LytB domain protein